MRAVTWQGQHDVRVDTVPDPTIEQPTDAIIRITSTGLCGSDLHLYQVLAPYMQAGDVLGHEPMGIVEAVGPEVGDLAVGDRVVIPFQIACGHCFMCEEGLPTQCETTQVREEGSGAALFGFSKLYGSVPGGQADLLRVPQAQYTHIKVPHDGPDDRYVYLSDVLPTAWQAVQYAAIPKGGSVVVLGLGPIGDMACRIARYQGAETVIAVDRVPDRLRRAADNGVVAIDMDSVEDVGAAVRDLTDGRGADSVIDAVGMEAKGSPATTLAHKAMGLLPDKMAEKFLDTAGIDRMDALLSAIDLVRRGGTVSVIGVYGGMVDPMPMKVMFDKQIQMRMGQANVKRWADDILPLLTAADPLGVESFATHRLALEDASDAYKCFLDKEDGMVKVLFSP